jgi:hypothetical protein
LRANASDDLRKVSLVLRAHPLQSQQPQQADQASLHGRCVGELQKVDRAALKSRLFIFERLDLELTDPFWPNRLSPVGQIGWVNFAERAWVNSDERQGMADDAVAAECDGILFPSQARHGGTNLVVYRSSGRPASQLRVYDPADMLKKIAMPRQMD